MGYILNRFAKLMELKNNSSINEQFELTAIIVHDPKDTDFIKHMRSHFLDFARFTGRNFLFITFIQPPKENAETIARDEFARLLVSDSKQLRGTDIIINPLIRKYYDIQEDGSYLVIAKKLSDKEVYKVRTTTASLPYQLLDLTKYCDTSNDFDELMRNLKGEPLVIKEILIDSLLKITSLISPSSRPDEYGLFSYDQFKMAKETIKKEKETLCMTIKQSSYDEDLTENVLKLYKIIELVHMEVLNEGLQKPIKIKTCENYRLLENDSQKFWHTYSRLNRFIDTSDREELDYSAFILYIGKIIETELNLSVCQMLRQSMGIDMPSYYNRYCPQIGLVKIPTSNYQEVPLNKYIRLGNGRTKLEGVALGNLLHAYKTAIGIEMSSDFTWKIPHREYLKPIKEDFLKLWKNIAIIRNDAAHCHLVNVDTYKTIENHFKVFQKTYMPDFYKIKEELRPKTNHNSR